MLKKDLISIFETIEDETLSLFNDYVPEKVTVIISKLNYLAKQVNEHLCTIIDEEGTDRVLLKRTQKALKEITRSIFSAMNHFQTLISNENADYDKLQELICIEEGKISLIIRFGIKCEPQLSTPDGGMREVYQWLQKVGEFNNDFYTVNYLYQNSVWKYLPQISAFDTAIVMQGPIEYKYNFTLETLYRYRAIYRDAVLILSTWKGEVTDEFRWRAESIGVILLETIMPEDNGAFNVKLQLLSSFTGISLASEFEEIKYVLKTRTDQRIFLPDFLTYMKNLLRMYKAQAEELTERVIFLGGYQSSCTCPFEICDFLAFGAVEDVKKIYESSGNSDRLCKDGAANPYYLSTRARVLLERAHADNFQEIQTMSEGERKDISRELMSFLCPETYIAITYYERVFAKRALTDEDDIHIHYWDFLKRCVIIVDQEQLQFYWFKYEHRYLNTTNLISTGNLTTSVWLDIYLNWEKDRETTEKV